MHNKIIQAFRKLLLDEGCTEIRISRKKALSGRIMYCSYDVRFVEPQGHNVIKGTLSLADMKDKLKRSPCAAKYT